MKTGRTIFALSLIIAVVISVISTPELYAQDNVATSFKDTFVSATADWWGKLKIEAQAIFKIAVTLEIAIFGIRMVLQRSNLDEILGQFALLIFYCAFIWLVIGKYQEWANIIAISGFEKLTGNLFSGGSAVNPGTPLDVALALAARVLDTISIFSGSVFTNAILVVLLVIMIVIFVLISALYILTFCEFHIVANVGVLLIGLGGSRTMKDYAINAMRYILSVGVKLFVLQLIMNIGFQILSVEAINNSAFEIKMIPLMEKLAQSLLLLAIAKTLPDTCAGILNGSSISSGNPLISAGRSAVSAAMTGGGLAMGAAKAGLGAAGALKSSYDVAKTQGGSGVGGMLKGMGSALLEARGGAKAAQLQASQGSTMSQLKSMGNMAKAQQAAKKKESLESMSAFFSGAGGASSAGASTSAEVATLNSDPFSDALRNTEAAPESAGASERPGFKQGGDEPPIWQQTKFKGQ